MSSKKIDLEVDIQAIVNRMMEVLGYSKEWELGQAIGIHRKNFSNQKKRAGKGRSMFVQKLVSLAQKNFINVDWMFSGEGETYIEPHPTTLDESQLDSSSAMRDSGSDPKIERLVDMTREILEVDKRLSGKLEENIESYHEAIFSDQADTPGTIKKNPSDPG